MPQYDYTKDPDFLRATEQEKQTYLTETDPDFRAASREEQQAYLAQFRQPSPAQPTAFQRLRKPVVEAAGTAMQAIVGPELPGVTRMPEARGAGETVAEFLTPETPAELGADIALGPAGRVANVLLRGGRLAQRGGRLATRVAGAGAGGYAGAEVSGAADPEGEAWRAGAGALGGEALGSFTEFIARRIPGRARRMQAGYQRQVGAAAEEIIPEFGKLKTGDDFVRLALEARSVRSGGGTLGKILDDADDRVRNALGKKQLEIPQTTELMLPGPKTPAGPQGIARGVMKRTYVSNLTYDQAIAQLQSLHKRAYTFDAAKRTELAEQAREQAAGLRAAIMDELEKKASPKVAALWDVSRRKYAQGLELAKEVKRSLVPGYEEAYLDEPTMQRVAFKRLENAQQSFKREMDKLDMWHEAVTRGTKIGRISELPGAQPTPGLYMTPSGRLSGFLRLGGLTRPGRYVGERETTPTGRLLADFLSIKGMQREEER